MLCNDCKDKLNSKFSIILGENDEVTIANLVCKIEELTQEKLRLESQVIELNKMIGNTFKAAADKIGRSRVEYAPTEDQLDTLRYTTAISELQAQERVALGEHFRQEQARQRSIAMDQLRNSMLPDNYSSMPSQL